MRLFEHSPCVEVPGEAPAGDRSGRVQHARMPPTLWTLVLSARDLNSPDAHTALAQLCETYWYPLYTFVRRQGHDHHEAEDLTQAFFEHLFRRDWLKTIDQEKGRFRSFLLCSLANFLHSQRDKDHALKRGGGPGNFVAWNADLAEARLGAQPRLDTNPVLEFDRLWAAALAEKAIASLKAEYERLGKGSLFIALSPYLTLPAPLGFYALTASALNMTEGALRTAMHRLIHRFGEVLRSAVAQTVADPTAVDAELRDVLKAWSAE